MFHICVFTEKEDAFFDPNCSNWVLSILKYFTVNVPLEVCVTATCTAATADQIGVKSVSQKTINFL